MYIENNTNMRGCITCQFYEIDRKFKVIGTRRIIEVGAYSGKCRALDKKFESNRNVDRMPPMGCSYARWIELPD